MGKLAKFKGMKSQLPNIPEDIIIIHILSRLPVKSLLRFKCVSKLWLSSISNPKFRLSNPRQRAIIMTWEQLDLSLYSIDDDDEEFVQHLPKPWSINESRSLCGRKNVFFVGSCNGLLLIGLDEAFFLWNPSTREYAKVLTLDGLFHDDYVFPCASGFCYDCSLDDYKAVLAIEHDHIGVRYVMVASFKTKHWIEVSFPYHFDFVISGPLVNGFLHWRVKNTDEDPFFGSHKIVYFDQLTDKFSEIPMPMPKHREDRKTIVGLGVLDGCLCMARCDIESDHYVFEGKIEVLAMKEYGVKESWTPLFSILNINVSYFGILNLLFLTNNGEVMMMREGDIILAYNTKEKSCRKTQIPNAGPSFQGASTFVESLVSPHRYH